MEIAYLCRLRAVEVVNLTEANALEAGILTNRRKGSRDNVVRWNARLRHAWSAPASSPPATPAGRRKAARYRWTSPAAHCLWAPASTPSPGQAWIAPGTA